MTDIPIGKLSKATDVKIETIRYYEKIGIMPKPPRTAGHHRLYDAAHLSRLRFIKRSRELGFSLHDIRSLLGLEDKTPTCGEALQITHSHLGAVRQKIRDLRDLERQLQRISESCAGGDSPDCGIIEALRSS